MPSVKPRYKGYEIRPQLGGKLMSAVSSEAAGVANYTVKRDWRRVLDAEKRREGYDVFRPNLLLAGSSSFNWQTYPGGAQLDSLTFGGGLVTATRARGHHYENGETIVISGAIHSAYNGTFTIQNVTATTFQYPIGSSPTSPDGGTNLFAAPIEPINLVAELLAENGRRAVIAGSPRRLYRFFALEDGAYYLGDGTPAAYFQEPPNPNTPYYDDNPGVWMTIGWGFSTSGRRWETVCIGGTMVFNNGVDLPCSYRFGDLQVTPLYELREQGIASVGTIAEYNGILHCADISEIFQSQLPGLLGFTGDISGGDILAIQSGNTVRLVSSIVPGFFTVSMVGKTVVWADGTSVDITAFIDDLRVTVGGPALSTAPQKFTLRTKASQAGSASSGAITASLPGSGFLTVTSSAPFFDAGMVGKTLRFGNGFSRVIATFTDNQHVILTAPGQTSPITDYPFRIITDPTDFLVNSASAIFTSDMVGRHIIWDNRETRKIVAFNSSTQVKVDSDLPEASGFIRFENLTSYARYTNTQFIDRTQYRLIWSMIGLPDRFASAVPGSILAGTNQLLLDYPALSFKSGQTIEIVGAGTDGGNLQAKILMVAGLGSQLLLDTFAVTSVTGALVQQVDSIGSIVGQEDLQDDSSAILKMLALGNVLIIYKDTSIFTETYTGDVNAPFQWRPIKIPVSQALFYRNTPVNVGAAYHIYAGKTEFYRFGLSLLQPEILVDFQLMGNLFYEQALLTNTEQIFGVENGITREAWWAFPSQTSDQAITFDYTFNSLATTSIACTAACTVRKPAAGIPIGAAENWFVFGTSSGMVLIGGFMAQPQALPDWNNGSEIYWRRGANPYSDQQNGYESRLNFGLGSFGSNYREKDLRSILVLFSSLSDQTTLLVELLGGRNTNETLAALGSQAITREANLIPVFFRENYFQVNLVTSGRSNPCLYSGLDFDVAIVDSRSANR